jgi:hypothetical protein
MKEHDKNSSKFSKFKLNLFFRVYQTPVNGIIRLLIHREYFKNKTSIFCEKLPEGTHLFNISLQTRFSGEFTLNPAKA